MDRGEQILRTLIELWCDQNNCEIVNLEITHEKKNINNTASDIAVAN